MSKVIKMENNLATESGNVIFDYNPKGMEQSIPQMAKGFVRAEGSRVESGFKINELIANKIGVADKEAELIEERVDSLVIERLKEVQENSYKEAFELGKNEGRESAYQEARTELDGKILEFTSLVELISNLKKELISQNEAHIVNLVTKLATKLAMKEIEGNPGVIIDIVSLAVEEVKKEEDIKVLISASDYGLINEMDGSVKKKLEGLENLKLEASEDITSGGCVVETNYGIIDLTIEERINKLWKIMGDRSPQVKEKVG